MKNSYLILFVVFSKFAAGQDFRQVLTAMQKEYKNAEQLNIVMNVKVFDNPASVKPFYNEKVEICKDGSDYSYRYASNEMLMNGDCMVMIDHEAKEMVYSIRDAKAQEKYMSQFKFSMDSILSFYETPEYKGTRDKTDHYKLIQKTGEVKQVEFFINTDTHLIQRITYTYREGQFVSIEFLKFDRHPSFKAGQFDERQFVTKVKDKLTPSAHFSQYKVWDANAETEK